MAIRYFSFRRTLSAASWGRKPMRRNTRAALIMMETRLVRNSRKAPPAMAPWWLLRPYPTTASGGMTATAMATPGMIVMATAPVRSARVPASPERTAMKRSSRFGLVRARISGVTCFKGLSQATSDVIRITPPMLNPSTMADFRPSFPSPRSRASAAERMGFIKGEINIAPMMTATLFWRRPKSAMRPARASMVKYPGSMWLDARTEP